MKILIVGDELALINSLSHKYHKEGFKVFLMSQLDIKSKYIKKTYIDYKTENKLDLIFKNEAFDYVILLENTMPEFIVNILQSCKKNNVKHFIYLNSKKEGLNEELELVNKLISSYKDLNSFKCTSLKCGIIYGLGREEEFKDKTIFEILKGNKGILSNKKNTYLDISDLTEIMLLTINKSIEGSFNIKVGEILDTKDIRALVNGISIDEEVVEDDEFSKLSGFKRIHNIKDRLKGIIDKLNKDEKDTYRKQKKEDSFFRKKILLKIKPYVEIMALFIIVLIISRYVNSADSVLTLIDIKLIFIVIVGIAYGRKGSILATFLSCGLLIVEDISKGISIISIFVLSESLVQLLTYILVGIYVGYKSDIKNTRINHLELEIKRDEEEYGFLSELYDGTYKEKEELQEKIIGSKDSFGKIYGFVKKLDSLDSGSIFKESIDIIEQFMETSSVAIYTVRDNFLRLIVKSNNKDFNPKKSIRSSEVEKALLALENDEIYINKYFDENMPSMIAGIKDENKIISIITINEKDFSKMNLYYKNLFRVISSLIGANIIKASRFYEAQSEKIYIKNTIFLKWNEFKERLVLRSNAKKEKKLEYIILKIESSEDIKSLSAKVDSCIRYTDFAGLCENGDVYIVLLNTNINEANIPIKRFEKLGVKASVACEVIKNDEIIFN